MPEPDLFSTTCFSFDDQSGVLCRREGDALIVMLPWPTMKAFRRTGATGETTKACVPAFALPPDLLGATKAVATDGAPPSPQREWAENAGLKEIRAYCALIPPSIRVAVSAFRERHWHLLSWLGAGGPAAEQLLAANPALAFTVACGAELFTRGTPTHYMERQPRLAYRRQLDLLAQLGFPATERVRRIMKKIAPAAISFQRVRLLQSLVRSEEIAGRLAHLPAVNGAVLAMLENHTFLTVSDAALRQVASAQDEEAEDLAARLEQTVTLWGLVRPTTPLPTFAGAARIRRVSAEVRTDVVRVRRGAGLFPGPPVPPTGSIVHIDSMAMLVEEGRHQSNCVSSYAPDIRRGTIAVYRVLSPQRCTLSLRRRWDRWVISELEGAANSAASREARAAVKAWLRDAEAAKSTDRGASARD